jgi:hypothetical protein
MQIIEVLKFVQNVILQELALAGAVYYRWRQRNAKLHNGHIKIEEANYSND